MSEAYTQRYSSRIAGVLVAEHLSTDALGITMVCPFRMMRAPNALMRSHQDRRNILKNGLY